ncbi:FMN-binding protein [Paenibacillus zanthoxyli]|uniref:FMN-binding protein n=1 Tax=Paenibacillus zanthoxyli TaxID=369399 RepID=UPI0004709B43|nr:FMN-binding protein [Paenibacillus zanthoxyli]
MVLRNIMIGIIIIVLVGGIICWTLFSKELREGKNLPLTGVDFKRLADGTYTGTYEGGRFKWRANEVQVTVSSGKVARIALLKSTEGRPSEFTNELYDKVIRSQSLQVDTISGATITSKAYLKAVEDALLKAQK